MIPQSPARTNVIAVVIAMTAALFARAWLQINLVENGYETGYASDLAYLVVPPILLVLLFPVLIKDREFIRQQFRFDDLSVRLVLIAIAIGVFFRIAWHASIIARVAFGNLTVTGFYPTVDPLIVYECPAPHLVLLSIFVMSCLIPVIEEITHRAYVQTFFHRFGPFVAVLISTVAFVVFHRTDSWDFVFLGGLVLGAAYWISCSLWVPVIVHAVVNFIPEISLRCMEVRWKPDPGSIPLWTPGLLAAGIAVIAAAGTLWLLTSLRKRRGTHAPAPVTSQRVGDALNDM